MSTWLSVLLLPALIGVQVRIDIPGAEATDLAAARAGCERALGPGRCVVRAASESDAADEPPEPPAHRAQVSWRENGATARIRFVTTSDARTTAEQRELSFAEADARPARLEAIGLVVAAYVMGHAQGRASAEQVVPAEILDTPPPRPRWAADILFGAGPALDQGRARFVLGLRGAFRPLPGPVFLLVQLEGAQRFDDVDVRYGSAGLGAALWLTTPLPAVDLQLHLSVLAQHVAITAEHPQTGERAADGRLRMGGRFGVEVLTCPGGPLCIFGGARLDILSPAVRVEILGHSIGRQPVMGVDGLLGVRIAD